MPTQVDKSQAALSQPTSQYEDGKSRRGHDRYSKQEAEPEWYMLCRIGDVSKQAI